MLLHGGGDNLEEKAQTLLMKLQSLRFLFLSSLKVLHYELLIISKQTKTSSNLQLRLLEILPFLLNFFKVITVD